MPTPSSDDPKPMAANDSDGAKLIDLAEAQSEAAPASTAAVSTEPAASRQAEPPSETQAATQTGASKLTLLLLALLAISVGANFYQARQRSQLATEAQEFGLALDGAVTRIDEEMIRADRAEETLGAVDRSVETVNERIVALQESLSELREITKR